MDKSQIRQMMKERRQEYTPSPSSHLHSLLEMPQYHQAKYMGIYVSLPKEVNTFPIIEEALKNHHVCVPKVHGDMMEFYEIHSLDDLQVGTFHVLEPQGCIKVLPSQIDLMIVPLVAFDQTNHRVGYGKGYYDKYMSRDFNGYKVGLAYDWQEVDYIDYDSYDVVLDHVIVG